MRDIRILNQTQGQQIEYDEVLNRLGELQNRNLSALAKIALFDEGKALITNGFRAEPYSGMTIKVPTGTIVQREIDTVGNHGDIIGICIQTEDQFIAMDAADGVPRTDIVEGQIISVVDRTDNARIGNVVTGGGDTGSVVITNQVINRDVRYSLSVQKQKGTTTPTAATSASLTGTVAIAATIDLSEQYLLYMADGEDSDWQEIDCRGAIPAATTRAEIISAINTAVGWTMAADGAGNTVELTGQGTGERSYFAFKPPITDSNADALEVIFGVSIGGLYKYEYEGTNSWIKLAEIDIGAADVEITSGMITDLDSKDSWTGGDDEILLKEPIMGDTLNVDTINESTLNNGVDIEGVHLEDNDISATDIDSSGTLTVDTINESTLNNGVDIEGVNIKDNDISATEIKEKTKFSKTTMNDLKLNWIGAAQVGNDLNIAGPSYAAIAALNSTDIAFIDDSNDDLRCYRWDGSDWTQIGNDLNIVLSNYPTMTALSSTDIVLFDINSDTLRTYQFDGTDWTQIGSSFSISVANDRFAEITALNSTDIAFMDSDSQNLRCYRFNGSTWSQVGNDLNISGPTGFMGLTTLNNTDIAYIDTVNDDLRCYRFDGTNWAQVGNDLNISGIASKPTICALNGSDIVYFDVGIDEFRFYRFDGTNWTKIGPSIPNSDAGRPYMTAINGCEIAYYCPGGTSDLRTYRFTFAISFPYNPNHPKWS